MALFVAAYLGVIPKNKVEQFRGVVEQVPVVGRIFAKDAPAPKKAPVKKKAAPAAKPK